MKHFEQKCMTHTVPLSWNQMFNKRERIFCSNLWEPLFHSRSFNFTSVCSSCDRHSKNTKTFSYRQIKSNRKSTHFSQIKKFECFRKYLHKRTEDTWQDSQSHNQAHIHTVHAIIEKKVQSASRSNSRAMWPQCSFRQTENTQTHRTNSLTIPNISYLLNEVVTTKFSDHFL